MSLHIYEYNVTKFNFEEILKDILKTDDLTGLHTKLEDAYEVPTGVDGLGNDTHSKYHQQFYDNIKLSVSAFRELYIKFIEEEIAPKFPNEKSLIYQALPSFRIQYPQSKAVTTWHYDSDENHKHPLGELNILVPITEMFDTNAVWMESLPHMGDFRPMNLKYGQYIIWNGNRCRHGNKANTTGLTRISIDMRVLPNACYDEKYNLCAATTGKKFIIGEYYSQINGDLNV